MIPDRGVFILIILGVFMGGALTLFSVRASGIRKQGRLFIRQPRKRIGR
jgi:cytochrome c biogenesis factor